MGTMSKKIYTESNFIIIVEDNDTMRLGMSETLQRAGYRVQAYDQAGQALEKIKALNPELVITDLRMEPMDGLQLLREMKEVGLPTQVLLVSAYGTVDDAVKAMQLGAADFLTKPFSPDELRIRVQKIMEQRAAEQLIDQLQEQNRYLRQEVDTPYAWLVGRSPSMRRIFELIDRVAGEDSSVLIQGESGTGKELVARAIHRKSLRNKGPFIKVNCAALNDNLLESELFGHEKGSFTGALRRKKGRFELADQGTLFLDEIGDVSSAMQVKLLRVLQEKEFERVGGEQTIRVDVRVIAATNQNLANLVHSGRFREDLFYRLNVIPMNLPPLRQRKEDLPLLAEHFLKKLNSKKRLSADAIKIMQNYSWPGNVRELENLMERLHVIVREEEIGADTIAAYLSPQVGLHPSTEAMNLNDAVFQFEKQLIEHALQQSGGIKNRAAKMLGIRTSALYYKLEKFGLI